VSEVTFKFHPARVFWLGVILGSGGACGVSFILAMNELLVAIAFRLLGAPS
jgi:hypothetical protein